MSSMMNRWEAVTRIVTAFVDKGHPGYALIIMVMLCVAATIISLAVVGRLMP